MKTPSKKQVNYVDNSLALLAFILFVSAGFFSLKYPKPLLELDKQSTAVNINDDLLRYMSLGNKRLITDFIWVKTLIESDLDHYKRKDLNSWMYLRFKTIATLDPLFYENFNWGGRYLSIVKDDLPGAVEIYKRGLNSFPDDYSLNNGLGFTYYFELSEPAKGLPYLEKIMNYPQAPSYYKSIVGKLRLNLNFDYDAALLFIGDLISKTEDKVLKTKLQADFYAVKAERDLKCLNNHEQNCELRDANGESYVAKGDKYYSPQFFVPYRLKKKGDLTKSESVNFMK